MRKLLQSSRTLFQPLLWLILLGFARLAAGQTPALIWQKTLGGSSTDKAYATISPWYREGYLLAGSTESSDGDVTGHHGGSDFWVVKLDSNRNKVWQKALGGAGFDEAKAVVATWDGDGGYVVAGSTNSVNGDVTTSHGGLDCWIVKLDEEGNTIWQKSFGGTGDDAAYAITNSGDGGYVVAGSTRSTDGDVTGNHGGTDYWIIKLDEAGSLVWQKTFGGQNNESASAITGSSDGGYVVAGYTQSTDGDVVGNGVSSAYWVIKVDRAGKLVWQTPLSLFSNQFASAITASRDQGFVVAGWTRTDTGTGDAWVVKLDAVGRLVWQKTLGGTNDDVATAIDATVAGEVIIAGQTLSTDGDGTGNHGNADAWIVKLDAAGQKVWQKTLGGTSNDGALGLLYISEGGYLVTGFSESNNGEVSGNHGAADYWLALLETSPSITALTASSTAVCSGKPVLITAFIGNNTRSYSYTITNGADINIQDGSYSQTLSQVVNARGSGTQSFTLTVRNAAGSASATLPILINSDGSCNIPTPCVSRWSGDWSEYYIWLCGHVPTVNDLVTINYGHSITISNGSAQAKQLKNNGGYIYFYKPGAKLFLKGD